VLDQRPVDHRQHLLRHGLGGRQEPGAEACGGENGFADRSHEIASIVIASRFICLGIAEALIALNRAAD
jgi:hypothetical protein